MRTSCRVIYFSQTLFDIMSAATFEPGRIFMKKTSWISACVATLIMQSAKEDQSIEAAAEFAPPADRGGDSALLTAL